MAHQSQIHEMLFDDMMMKMIVQYEIIAFFFSSLLLLLFTHINLPHIVIGVMGIIWKYYYFTCTAMATREQEESNKKGQQLKCSKCGKKKY